MIEYFYPTDLSSCIPFLRGDGPSDSGPRIGGRAPVEVDPKKRPAEACYLLTLPLTKAGDFEFSVFFNGPLFQEMVDVPDNQLVGPKHPAIEVVVHRKSERRKDHRYSTELTEHPMVFGESRSDEDFDDSGGLIVYPFHKIGGKPFFNEQMAEIALATDGLFQTGYFQLLQLEYIVPTELDWSGEWPFAEGLFYLFSRPPHKAKDWLWLWNF